MWRLLGLSLALAVPATIAPGQDVPRTWDEAAITTMHLPVAATGQHAVPVSASYYERMPELRIYRSYPVYHPDREPEGYMARLASLEPEVVFDADGLRTEEDWVRAGEHVFDAPIVHLPAGEARGLMLENPDSCTSCTRCPRSKASSRSTTHRCR